MGEAERVPGTERRPAGSELVERGAQRVQVGPLIHRPAGAPGLLRREIRQRPHQLAVVGELRAHLRHRRRQREVHQARDTVIGQHDVGRGDVAVHHPPPVHPGHGPRQRHREPDQVIDRQRLHQRRGARAANVGEHDRVRIPRSIHRLRDPVQPAQALEHRPLMLEPPDRVRPQRLLTDHRPPRQEQPGHPRAPALVQGLGSNRRIAVRQHPDRTHPTPPRRSNPSCAYTHSRAQATTHPDATARRSLVTGEARARDRHSGDRPRWRAWFTYRLPGTCRSGDQQGERR